MVALGRVLEADRWISRVRESSLQDGASEAAVAALCLVLAGVLQTRHGQWMMDACVDAERKLGVSHCELAHILETAAQRLTIIHLGRHEGGTDGDDTRDEALYR